MDFFAKLYRIPKKIRSERINFLLDLVKLSEFKSRLISKCSGGMRRRCSFAVALINDPKILILDEPTVGIDPELRNTFWDYFQDISKKFGATILITTHYLAESVRCDRVGLIDKTIIKSGTPLQLQEQLQKENNLEKLPDMEEVFIYYTKKSRGDKN
jgi:ABC-2 type transport system ATP-binding protein